MASLSTATGGAVTLDHSVAEVWEVTVNAPCTITLGGGTAGQANPITAILMQDAVGGHSVTWPASVVWEGGVAPPINTAANQSTVITVFTTDGGGTWLGFVDEKQQSPPFLSVSLSANTSLPAVTFTKILLDAVESDTASGWDAAASEYVVPVSGVYSVVSKLRPQDAILANGLPQDVSYGQGVDTVAADGAWFIWGVGAPERHGLLNERVAHFTAGDRIFLYAYNGDPVNAVDIIPQGTGLQLYLVRRD